MFTLLLRFRVAELPTGQLFSGGESFLASKYDRISGNGWVLRLGSEMEPCFSFVANKVATHMSAQPPLPPPQVSVYTAVVPIPLKTWIEIEITHNGTTATMYLNGHLCARNAGAFSQCDLPLKMGNANWSNDYKPFNGDIEAPPHLLDRALSQDEIQHSLWPTEAIRFSSTDAAEAIRQALLQFIWSPGQPATEPDSMPFKALIEPVPITPGDRFSYLRPFCRKIERLNILMDYGISSFGFLFTPLLSNDQLFIYHAGHDQGPFFEDVFTNNAGQEPGLIIPTLLKVNYSVLAFGMPVWDMDERYPTVEIFGRGTITLKSHENLFSYLERPSRFFFEPIARSLNLLQAGPRPFEQVNMIGLSGGGWTTTLYAALDSRIKHSFPVAGSVPNYLRIGQETLGDAEQDDPNLYTIANYKELYVLGSIGEGRSQLQVLNQFDPACFWQTVNREQEWVPEVKAAVAKIGCGSYEFTWDESHHNHQISQFAINEILKSLA